VKLVFCGEEVFIIVDGQTWSKTLTRPTSTPPSAIILWMQNGGESGVEQDDIQGTETTP